ncbi:MAG: ABC transporter ATP-binding protein [Chloroflexi bacterium]|nr:ABC transporter ATP-binding protein [Chloroflexota bacterium]
MTGERQPPAVEVHDVTFAYDGLKALDSLSLEVPAGVSYGLLGPNGAGKSTLIRLLVGLLKPQRGSVLVLGESPSPRNASHIGYMPQLSALYLELSVIENADFFGRISGLSQREERRRRVEDVLQLVDLWDRRDSLTLHLSGGMRQRLSLACALVHDPRVLFLDEPTVGLDPELRVLFWDHFRRLTERGRTLIVSSHSMDDAAHCDRLAFLRAGGLVAQGSPQELRAATGNQASSLEDAFLFFARKGLLGER